MTKKSVDREILTFRKNPEERFKTVASYRVSRIITFIRLLRKCSMAPSYKYTNEQAQYMFQEIEKELNKTKEYFLESNNENKPKEFSFDYLDNPQKEKP
ncbi:MAG: hypothetical protein OXE77_04675 [Flavobacteriaceae bacterium]|nr:hypothetical protein [Flavobacteriaceae bacterium]MCY4267285.1 hypothetical protein [Flavobacteriaceae bacterium]